MVKVRLQTTYGDMTLELDDEKAPATTESFLAYVRDGFYDGTLFHRVINGFMIQGGGFTAGMKQKKTREPVKNEANNNLSNVYGTVAMARTSDPHSATAQFFINVKDNLFLDFKDPTPQGWGYCVFGRVVDGADTLEKIKGVKTTSRAGHGDVPEEDVVIERAELLEG